MGAYEKAAHANERGGGTLWHAAKHLETAAAIAKDLGKWDAVYDYTDRAATLFVEAGKIAVGAPPQPLPHPSHACDAALCGSSM